MGVATTIFLVVLALLLAPTIFKIIDFFLKSKEEREAIARAEEEKQQRREDEGIVATGIRILVGDAIVDALQNKPKGLTPEEIKTFSKETKGKFNPKGWCYPFDFGSKEWIAAGRPTVADCQKFNKKIPVVANPTNTEAIILKGKKGRGVR